MAEVVNLRLARKAKQRDAATAEAAQNRAAFGRTRAEKQAKASDLARNEARLDELKRDR